MCTSSTSSPQVVNSPSLVVPTIPARHENLVSYYLQTFVYIPWREVRKLHHYSDFLPQPEHNL